MLIDVMKMVFLVEVSTQGWECRFELSKPGQVWEFALAANPA